MIVSTDSWIEAALEEGSTKLADLIISLPPSSSQPTAATMAQTSSLESRVFALRLVSQDHSAGGDPEMAVELATVGISFCQRAFEQDGPGEADAFIFGVAQFSVDAHRAYDRLDRHTEQLAVLEEGLQWLTERGAEERNLIDLQFGRIEALIELGRLEEARDGLNAEVKEGRSGHSLYPILNQRLGTRLISAVERRDDRSIEEQLADQRQDSLRSAVQGLSSIAPEFSGLLEQLSAQVDDQREALSLSDSIARDSSAYQSLGNFMENFAGGSGNQIRLNTAIQQASIVLADPARGQEPDLLEQARKSLEDVRQEAIKLQLKDTAIDTLWPLYICYKRLEQYGEALVALQMIRGWVNVRRAMIQDPLERAGFSKQYPLLYLELGARLFQQGDSAELLSVIEEAKGRALTDLLEGQARREGLAQPSEPAANWLPKLMIALNSHYLTYLSDEDVTYAVFVAKDGSLRSARISIGSNLMNELRGDLNPITWGKKSTGFTASSDDVAQQLSPLVDWLGELVDAGILNQGEHICYSPDGLFHLVPLHYVDFRGMPLVKLVSLSRTHSATLLNNFAQKPVTRPEHYVAVKVPLASEAANDPNKVNLLELVAEWLNRGLLRGTRLYDEEADLPTLASQDLKNALVHFATHGYFPERNENTDAFHGSGLLLSNEGQLPNNAKSHGLLSPQRIIETGSPFKFDGTHVTLQACLSGLSEEGVGGDALGLEWSLLIAGACSVLSTHWAIEVESSAEFSIRFYEGWLVNHLSRAQAWRNAVLGQMDEDRAFDGELAYHWAAYSLAGDWR